jgi:cell division protein ZapA
MLDHRMREIHQTGRVIGTDRIAVMAALNIAHELIQAKHKRGETSGETNRRLSDLQDRIAEALAD